MRPGGVAPRGAAMAAFRAAWRGAGGPRRAPLVPGRPRPARYPTGPRWRTGACLRVPFPAGSPRETRRSEREFTHAKEREREREGRREAGEGGALTSSWKARGCLLASFETRRGVLKRNGPSDTIRARTLISLYRWRTGSFSDGSDSRLSSPSDASM